MSRSGRYTVCRVDGMEVVETKYGDQLLKVCYHLEGNPSARGYILSRNTFGCVVIGGVYTLKYLNLFKVR